MSSPNPYEIEVSVKDDIDEHGHSEIGVGGRTDECDELPVEEVHAAALYVAGIVARVAVAAAPWVALEAQRHGCRARVWVGEQMGQGPEEPPLVDDACHVSGRETVLRPSEDFGYPPAAYLTVPTSEVPAWLARIRSWLDQLAAEEALSWP